MIYPEDPPSVLSFKIPIMYMCVFLMNFRIFIINFLEVQLTYVKSRPILSAYELWHVYTHLCNNHHNQDVEHFHLPQRLLCPFAVLFPITLVLGSSWWLCHYRNSLEFQTIYLNVCSKQSFVSAFCCTVKWF